MWKQSKSSIVFFFLFLGCLAFMVTKFNKTDDKSLKVWMRFEPVSTDPLDYDLDVHHMTMRSVYASMVSLYGNGKITPQIAKSWTVSNDAKEWVLLLDDDWKFSNGEKITPEVVIKNWKRVLFIKNKLNSKSGLLEYLKGANSFDDLTDEIEGIKFQGEKIFLEFVKPMPNFLEKISFGLYGIAHPSMFDSKTGSWKNRKETISSGHYIISHWGQDTFELKVRKDSILNQQKNAIKTIIFNFSKSPIEIIKSDLMFREKLNYLVDEKEWSFASTLEDSNIVYVKVMKWDDPKSLFFNKETRKYLRSVFYKNLARSGYKPVISFFPLSIKNVKELTLDEIEKVTHFPFKEITMPPFFAPLKNAINHNKRDLGEIFQDGFGKFCHEIGAKPLIAQYPENESEEKKVFDLQYLGTGIDVNDPLEDIRFMFLSKHGIRLPDSNGEIHALLDKKEEIDVQKINQELWEQAIIWPIRHYSQGFWIKNSSNINTSKLNLALNPIDFQFLEWN